eukprot:TRINITY_DN18662_c0_g1_i2.p1 TRINITY_DN18662_c0_g1~~TRINITY_DN18662_c0_g1_i2.p1  ORF type:complete len:492 (-),score=59.90 TRINITY_DN18662_c0_g1_i2:89-1393(-)
MEDSQAHREAHRKEHAEWVRAHRYNSRHEPRLDDYRGKPCYRFKYNSSSGLYLLRSFCTIVFRINTLLVVSLAIAATIICFKMNWIFDLPTTFLSAGIVFPISFGIQFSFNRRERVLLDIASLKSSAFALYALSKEWPPLNSKPRGKSPFEYPGSSEYIQLMGINEGEFCERMKQHLTDLLHEMTVYISHNDSADKSQIYAIYSKFDELSHFLEDIRISDDWIKSVVSRAYQYLRYMINDFERIRTVVDFRTPSVYRGFSLVMLTAFPILFAPSFAKIGHDENNITAAVYSSGIITLILVALNNIMNDLEDPFDGVGADDLNVSMITEPVLLMYKPLTKPGFTTRDLRMSKILLRRPSTPDASDDIVHSGARTGITTTIIGTTTITGTETGIITGPITGTGTITIKGTGAETVTEPEPEQSPTTEEAQLKTKFL